MTTGTGIIAAALIVLLATGYPVFLGLVFSSGSLSVVTLLNGIIMFASSFVEEEQQFWYWITSGWWVLVALKERRQGHSGLRAIGILAITRIIRRWNQTGQKHAGAPDIVRTFFSNHPDYLWVLIFITYTSLFSRLAARAFQVTGKQLGVVLSISIVTANAGFKVASAAQDSPELIPSWLQPVVEILKPVSLVTQAQTAFVSLLTGFVATLLGLRAKGPQNLGTLHDTGRICLCC